MTATPPTQDVLDDCEKLRAHIAQHIGRDQLPAADINQCAKLRAQIVQHLCRLDSATLKKLRSVPELVPGLTTEGRNLLASLASVRRARLKANNRRKRTKEAAAAATATAATATAAATPTPAPVELPPIAYAPAPHEPEHKSTTLRLPKKASKQAAQ